MPLSRIRIAPLTIAALLATSACGGTVSVLQNAPAETSVTQGARAKIVPNDNTSILNKLTKQVTIGSAVDPTNGDKGPRALTIVKTNYGLKKGQLLYCDFEDSSGTAGNGTSVDVINGSASSTPKTLVQSSLIEGCDADALTSGNQVYAGGMNGTKLVYFDQTGKQKKTYAPFAGVCGNGDAAPPASNLYAPEYIFTTDCSGHIVSLSLGSYGTGKLLEVAKGFDVNGKTGWSYLGAAGFAYYAKKDLLYIVDGVDNTLVAFTHASNLLEKDEIVVQKGGKTFKCLHPQTTCGKLVFSGSPLNAPVAAAILPNGNVVVANGGDNNLVEISSAGTVLATKSVDSGNSPGVTGIVASGSNDNNTVLYFSDGTANVIGELEQ
jgi:hypothetical protein